MWSPVGNPENVHTQEDLCGKSVAAQTGTVEVDYLQGTGEYEGEGLSAACEAAGPRGDRHPDLPEGRPTRCSRFRAPRSRRTSSTRRSPAINVAQHPDSFELSGLALEVVKQGIAVPKEKPELKQQVQRALGTMVRDGSYIAILETYGVADGNVFNQ